MVRSLIKQDFAKATGPWGTPFKIQFTVLLIKHISTAWNNDGPITKPWGAPFFILFFFSYLKTLQYSTVQTVKSKKDKNIVDKTNLEVHLSIYLYLQFYLSCITEKPKAPFLAQILKNPNVETITGPLLNLEEALVHFSCISIPWNITFNSQVYFIQKTRITSR